MTETSKRYRDTSAATAAWKRKAEERAADGLRARGWTCVPPGGSQRVEFSEPTAVKGVCDCESYDCDGSCCGVGNCTCTTGGCE